MHDVIETAPYGILGAWLVLSVLNQFHYGRWIKPIKRFDRFGLLPDWALFAPAPMLSDYRLLYRDMVATHTVTAWKEIDFRNHSALQRAVWHPERRIQKGLNAAAGSLVRRTIDPGRFERRRLLELPYILILNYVEQQPRDFRAIRRQFILARTDGAGSDRSPRIAFVSAFHVLPEA
jgi:hypothetical protein